VSGTLGRKRQNATVTDRRYKVANTAPPAAGSAPLTTSAEALRTLRQNKHNPLPYLKPDMLARVLDQFEHGYLREACLLWEKIAERDDVIASVKPKREKDVSQLDMQVVVRPDAGADGDAHKEVLERFWKNVRCVNSYDRNERGGFRRLVKQMMTAVSYRYAAHHIIWQPRPDGELRATFEFVPLWMFENRTGRLRYLPSLSATGGEILADGEWMVTTGDGLMISCCIGYLAKRSAFNDWLVFSEKFSVPGVMGRTTAKKGSAEAEAMKAAVESFGHDWMAVIYGDDGTHAKPIELVQANGNPAGMPMPAVVERVDRKFAALYRGADLSSMSSNQGDGTGASLQEKETDILRRDDAETIAETLEEVSRMVIEWHFGNGVEPLARVELVVPVQEDTGEVIDAGIKLAEKGARVSTSALMERANIPEAKDDADVLGGVGKEDLNRQDAKSAKEDLIEGIENADVPEDLAQRLTAALSSDLQPLGMALAGALQAGDGAAFQGALKKISARMPEFLESEAMEELLADEMVRAFLGEGEEVENAGFNQSQPRLHGRWTDGGEGSAGSGKTSRRVESIPEVIHAAMSPGNQTFCDWADVDPYEISLIKEQFGMDLTGGKRVIVADEVRKILRDHGTDPIPVTYQDFEQLPQNIRRRAKVLVSEREGKHPRLISLIPNGDTTIVVEEVRTGRNKLALVSMHKAPGNDLAKITRTLRAIPEGKRRADG
jgi:phage gp29-like protein